MMPYLKVTYGSSQNVSVKGTDYVEVRDSDVPADPVQLDAYLSDQWQFFVNEYMSDTSVEIVESRDG